MVHVCWQHGKQQSSSLLFASQVLTVRGYSAKYGLPTDAGVVVLANFNTHDKLEPASFGVWMNILHRAPNAVLWLLEPKAPSTQDRLQAEAVSRGIALSRIIWAPRMPRLEHLARYV